MKRCASLVMLVSLGASATAHGSTSYPPHLRGVVGLSYTPDCTLCHSSDLGGDGTAIKPFGVSMLRLGALGNDNLASLTSALEADRRDRVDSDEDEIADIDELRQGSDPNRGVNGEAPLTPMTGCALSTRTPNSDGSGWAVLFAVSIAYAARRRRR